MCCVLSKYKRIKKLSTSLTNEFQISGIVKMTLSSRVTPANVNCMYRKYELLTTEEHAMADRCHDIYALARSDITWRQRRATEYWLKFKHRNTDQTPKYNVWLLNLVQYAIAILLYQTTVIIEDGSIIAASVFFSAKCNLYISRLCYGVSLSVCDGSTLGRGACREHSGCASQRSWSHHTIPNMAAADGGVISRYASHC